MRTILVWYLVSFGGNGVHHWSPPMLEEAECTRVQQVVNSVNYARNKCIQIRELIK